MASLFRPGTTCFLKTPEEVDKKKKAGTLDTRYKDELVLREVNTQPNYTMEGRIMRDR